MECPYCRKVDTNGHWRLATIPLTEEPDDSKFPETLEDTLGPIGCSICNSEFDPKIKPDVVLVECGHKFHFDCLGEYCNHRNRFLSKIAQLSNLFIITLFILFRIECPICHALEGGDWWHCPYGIHNSDVLVGAVVNTQTTANPPQRSASTFPQPFALQQDENSESEETMGLLESDELEGEERADHRRFTDQEDAPIGCTSCCRKLFKKWFIAWTRGASGELRSLRLLVLVMVILAGESAIRSSTLNSPKHNIIDQRAVKDKVLMLYLSSAIIPMLFCPGVLLLLPSILYIGLLLIKGFGHYYNTELDLILEPISSVCCLFMMFYWIKSNRVSATTSSSSSNGNRQRHWRSLDEIYLE